MAFGDSKTGDQTVSPNVVPAWIPTLQASLSQAAQLGNFARFSWAKGGTTVTDWKNIWMAQALSAATAAHVSDQAQYVLMNWGVNDVGFLTPWALPNQTTWQSNYLTLIDSVHAQFPLAKIYLTKPYKGGGVDSTFDTMAGWIDNIVAARPTFVFVGDDERAWFKPNIGTYSTDQVHCDAGTCQAASAAAKLTALGF